MATHISIKDLREDLGLAKLGIFNSDQRSQFSSDAFNGVLLDAGISIRVKRLDSALDNSFIVKTWRMVKQKDTYRRNT